MLASNQDPVLQLLREGCRKNVFPGVALCASRAGLVSYDHAVGHATTIPHRIPLVTQALFDVASLTKPMATVSSMMMLVDSGELELDQPVAQFVPAFDIEGKRAITIRHLLSHSSGLPAHIKFYEELDALREKGEGPAPGPDSIDWLVKRIAGIPSAPVATQTVYSDLGFMMLGHIIETISGQSLDLFSREHIFLPMGMEDTFFLPTTDPDGCKTRTHGRQVVATEDCFRRHRVLAGEVHDNNCHALGGVSGHAGLFSTIADVHRFGLTMLRCSKGAMTFFPPKLVQEFWGRALLVPGSTWALGWDTPSAEESSAGEFFSKQSAGHLGFTGCSLWIDREAEVVVVLLSNRVHPTRENDQIKRFRPLVHNTIMGLISQAASMPAPRQIGGASLPFSLEELERIRQLPQNQENRWLNPPPTPQESTRRLAIQAEAAASRTEAMTIDNLASVRSESESTPKTEAVKRTSRPPAKLNPPSLKKSKKKKKR